MSGIKDLASRVFGDRKKDSIKKNSGPAKVIERSSKPRLENAWIKTSTGKMITPKIVGRHPDGVEIDTSSITTPYTFIHTHPMGYGIVSWPDLRKFASEPNQKSIITAQTTSEGKVLGYCAVRKTSTYNSNVAARLLQAPRYDEFSDSPLLKLRELRTQFPSLQIRFIPAKGYEFDKTNGVFIKKEKSKLAKWAEKVVVALFFAFFLFALDSSKMTGFSIFSTQHISSLYFLIPFLALVFGLFVFLLRKGIKEKMIKLIENEIKVPKS